MTTAKRIVICFLACATAFAATESMAQFPGRRSSGDGMRGGERSRLNDPGKDRRPAIQENITDLVEYRLALLEEDLRMSPGQQNAWQAYADKVRALASDISRERSRAQPDTPLNALQQMDRSVDVARNRLTALEDMSSTARVWYEGLNPQQKLLADSRIPTIVAALNGGSAAPNAGERMDRARNPQ